MSACSKLASSAARPPVSVEYRSVTGGLLAQTRDLARVGVADLTVVTRRKPTEQEIADLLFAWRVCKFVKSNAIVLARAGATARRRCGTDEPGVLDSPRRA